MSDIIETQEREAIGSSGLLSGSGNAPLTEKKLRIPDLQTVRYSLGNELVFMMNFVNKATHKLELLWETLEQLIVVDVTCRQCHRPVDKSGCEVATGGIEYQMLRRQMGCYSVPEGLLHRIAMFHGTQLALIQQKSCTTSASFANQSRTGFRNAFCSPGPI